MSESSLLIESFLYQNESTSLDFKCQPYPFTGATDEQKSELLKDVLAFANSWRQGDAYIVTGMIDVADGPNDPIGIDTNNDFDDAQLQQFISGKTNRPIEIAYERHYYGGKTLGVIKIAKQDRPTYAKRDYGKVKKEVVYYRRGSSTATATPELIAQMGRDSIQMDPVSPTLALQFADYDTREKFGTSISIQSIVIASPTGRLPTLETPKAHIGGYQLPTMNPLEERNGNYWRELEVYVRENLLCKPVSLLIENTSTVTATQVRVEISISASGGIQVTDNLPDEPVRSHIESLKHFKPVWHQQSSPLIVKKHQNSWTITVLGGDLSPKADFWLEQPFYVGSTELEHLSVEALIFANNLPEPQRVALHIDFAITHKEALTIEELQAIF
jgi:Putative DNA-binding domain